MYNRLSLAGGSLVFWIYMIQIITGFLLMLMYTWVFEGGNPGMSLVWWETWTGSFLARLHSEGGNLVFLFVYIHIFSKYWTESVKSEIDSSWLSGGLIFLATYITGLTGAIMPMSILSEVTATVIGSAISSMSFLQFDFLETILIPGCALNDETSLRVFLMHALIPMFGVFFIVDHLNNLHNTNYTDEDIHNPYFFMRYEYWSEFWHFEFAFWYEVIFILLVTRYIGELYSHIELKVSYNLSNLEYWPITEEIDFVLAIPHWYLRPLMGSLVLIPHHYLGFFYVIFFFILFITNTWFGDNWNYFGHLNIKIFNKLKLSNDLSYINKWNYLLFIGSFVYVTLIVPTGRYFITVGSCEMLVFSYCYIWFYIIWGYYTSDVVSSYIIYF